MPRTYPSGMPDLLSVSSPTPCDVMSHCSQQHRTAREPACSARLGNDREGQAGRGNEELDFDPLVDPANITVKNMTGDVALNGTVPSYPQCREAAAAARRVQGVTKVHHHLM